MEEKTGSKDLIMNNLFRMYKFMQETQEINHSSLSTFSQDMSQANPNSQTQPVLAVHSTVNANPSHSHNSLPVMNNNNNNTSIQLPNHPPQQQNQNNYMSNQYSSIYNSNKLESQTQFVNFCKESAINMSQDDNQQYLSNHIVQMQQINDEPFDQNKPDENQQQFEVIRNSCQLLSSNLNYNQGEIITNVQNDQYQIIKNNYDKTLHRIQKSNDKTDYNSDFFDSHYESIHNNDQIDEEVQDNYQKDILRLMGKDKSNKKVEKHFPMNRQLKEITEINESQFRDSHDLNNNNSRHDDEYADDNSQMSIQKSIKFKDFNSQSAQQLISNRKSNGDLQTSPFENAEIVIEEQQKEIQLVNHQIQQLQKQKNNMEIDVKQQQKHLIEIERQIQNKQQDLDNQSQILDNQSQMLDKQSQMEKEFVDLKASNQELNQQLDCQQKHEDELKKQIQNLKQSFTSEQENMEQQYQQKISLLQNQLDEQSQSQDNGQEELMMQQKQNYMQQINELQQNLIQQQDKFQQQEYDQQFQTKEYEEILQNHNKMKQNYKQLQSQQQELQDQNQKYEQSQINQKKQVLLQAQENMKSSSIKDNSISDLQEKIIKLQQQEQQQKEQNDNDKDQIKILIEENIQLKLQISQNLQKSVSQQQQSPEKSRTSSYIDMNEFSFAQENKDFKNESEVVKNNFLASVTFQIPENELNNQENKEKKPKKKKQKSAIDKLLQSKMPKNINDVNDDDDSSMDSLFSDEEQEEDQQQNDKQYLNYDFLLEQSNLNLQFLKQLYKQKKLKYSYSENKYFQEYQNNRHIRDNLKRESKVDNKLVRCFASGIKQLINLDNNQIKTMLPNQYTIIEFQNQDIKQVLPNKITIYYFQQQNITQITTPSGINLYKFLNNQVEVHLPNSKVECFRYNF